MHAVRPLVDGFRLDAEVQQAEPDVARGHGRPGGSEGDPYEPGSHAGGQHTAQDSVRAADRQKEGTQPGGNREPMGGGSEGSAQLSGSDARQPQAKDELDGYAVLWSAQRKLAGIALETERCIEDEGHGGRDGDRGEQRQRQAPAAAEPGQENHGNRPDRQQVVGQRCERLDHGRKRCHNLREGGLHGIGGAGRGDEHRQCEHQQGKRDRVGRTSGVSGGGGRTVEADPPPATRPGDKPDEIGGRSGATRVRAGVHHPVDPTITALDDEPLQGTEL